MTARVTRSSSPFVHLPFYLSQPRGPMSRGVCVLRMRGHKDSKAPGTAYVPTDEATSSPPKRLQFILSKYRKSQESVKDAGEAGDSESFEGSPPNDAFAHAKDNQTAPVRTYRGVPIVPSSRTQIDSVDNITEASGQLLSRAANEGLLRRVVTSRLQNQGESIEEKRSRLFDMDPVTGDEKPIIGYYGENKLQWWSLWVREGRESQLAGAIERLVQLMPPLDSGEERTVQCWVPSKKIRAWSPKTGKMGYKTLKYGDGGWLFVKTVLDSELEATLSKNVNFLGFRHREVFEETTFPKPAPPECLQEVREWEADLSEMDEPAVRQYLGLPPPTAPTLTWEEPDDLRAAYFEKKKRLSMSRDNNFTSSGSGLVSRFRDRGQRRNSDEEFWDDFSADRRSMDGRGRSMQRGGTRGGGRRGGRRGGGGDHRSDSVRSPVGAGGANTDTNRTGGWYEGTSSSSWDSTRSWDVMDDFNIDTYGSGSRQYQETKKEAKTVANDSDKAESSESSENSESREKRQSLLDDDEFSAWFDASASSFSDSSDNEFAFGETFGKGWIDEDVYGSGSHSSPSKAVSGRRSHDSFARSSRREGRGRGGTRRSNTGRSFRNDNAGPRRNDSERSSSSTVSSDLSWWDDVVDDGEAGGGVLNE